MSEHQSLLGQKLMANKRRLKRGDRVKSLGAQGLRVSALGAVQHDAIIRAFRELHTDDEREISISELAEELSSIGSTDTLFVFHWNADREPGFVVPIDQVIDAVKRNVSVFGPDGFVAIDSELSQALIVDIDELGKLNVQKAVKNA